jgi:pyruvate/2-oxoglutarate dehydrogenase complex dihydrolipoamide acyltransferase (E2) component
MKMEAPITSTSAGILATLTVPTGTQVEPGDLIATLTLKRPRFCAAPIRVSALG